MVTGAPGKTRHETLIEAPAATVYAIVAGAREWPRYFTPCLHVEREDLSGGRERLHIWALAAGTVKNWTSIRSVAEQSRRIRFRQEIPAPPVAAMSGLWSVDEGPHGRTRLVLDHEFSVIGADPADLDHVAEVTEHNSATELANIKSIAESQHRRADLEHSFEDSVLVRGTPEAAYEFLYAAKSWPERLEHVSAMDLVENTAGVQSMTMHTCTADGSTHRTESVRICFPGERIVYKQTVPPALMRAHTGTWVIRPRGEDTEVVAGHTVVLAEDKLDVLGEGTDAATARRFVRDRLGANSTATLLAMKSFVEARS
ncbi:aromatase/cyclase [Sciscionella marina]|uniref:aromatase/cyclase n=1 Tax=Sciscionella marina TaxID=508770 RepID=UPI000476FCB9|nr:aromatase/cyclase [Sciscionella marina]